MKIEETQSVIKITEASINFVQDINKLPWQLFFWEATIISNEIFHTHIESKGIIEENEICQIIDDSYNELMEDEDIKIMFTLYFLKGDKK